MTHSKLPVPIASIASYWCPVSQNIAHENLAVVLTDMGSHLKLAGNVETAIERYASRQQLAALLSYRPHDRLQMQV